MARLFPWQRRAWPVALLSCLLAACAAPGGGSGVVNAAERKDGPVQDAQASTLQGEGPFQRFIVRYRDGSAAAGDPADAQSRIARTAAKAGAVPPLAATWQRRLGVQADLFEVDRALDRAGASALMKAFSSDPDVEYIEVDQMMGIDPVQPTMPMRPRD